jgi:hypothetical protein
MSALSHGKGVMPAVFDFSVQGKMGRIRTERFLTLQKLTAQGSGNKKIPGICFINVSVYDVA